MICHNCKKEKGTVGNGLMLKRQGTVPGTHGMLRHIALCHECMKASTVQTPYEKASRGT